MTGLWLSHCSCENVFGQICDKRADAAVNAQYLLRTRKRRARTARQKHRTTGFGNLLARGDAHLNRCQRLTRCQSGIDHSPICENEIDIIPLPRRLAE